MASKAHAKIMPPARRAVVAASVCAALFVALACCVAFDAPWVAPFDASVGQAIAGARVEALNGVAAGLAFLGHVAGTLIVGAIMLVVLFALRLRKSALFLFVTMAVGTIVRYAIVYAIGRARPVGLLLSPSLGESSPSFPSGHTFTAVLLYTMFALIVFIYIMRRGKHTWVAWLVMAICVAIAICIAYSRLYIGVHYPTDVFGGLLLAGVMLCLCGSMYVRNVLTWEPSRPR